MQFKAWSGKTLESSRHDTRSIENEKLLMGDVVSGGVNALAKGALLFLSALMVYTVIPINNYSNGKVKLSSRAVKLHIPSGLDESHRRELTLNLGGGDCLWQVSMLYVYCRKL